MRLRQKKSYYSNESTQYNKLKSRNGVKPITFRTLHFIINNALFEFFETELVSIQEMNRLLDNSQNLNT